MDQKSKTPAYDDEITLREVAAEVRRSAKPLALLVAVCTLVGLTLGLVLEKEYLASTLLSPIAEDPTGKVGGLGALAGELGGLASLAGISLPGGKAKDEAVAVLQSEMLTETYIRDNNLLPILYAKMWDAGTGKWLTSDPKKVPTLWKANRLFARTIRSVAEDKKGLVVLSIRWKDPKLAARWANDLVKLTNVYLRDKAIAEAQRNIAYLNEQAAKTNIVEAQRTIYSLLQSEINKEMVARGREEYALKVIDPAFVPERPSSAGAIILSLLGFGVGCVLAVLIAFGRRVFFR